MAVAVAKVRLAGGSTSRPSLQDNGCCYLTITLRLPYDLEFGRLNDLFNALNTQIDGWRVVGGEGGAPKKGVALVEVHQRLGRRFWNWRPPSGGR